MSTDRLLIRLDDDDVAGALDTNLRAAIWGCKHASRRMMARAGRPGGGGGCIINVSSLLATKGRAGASVYAASKAGILGEFAHVCTPTRYPISSPVLALNCCFIFLSILSFLGPGKGEYLTVPFYLLVDRLNYIPLSGARPLGYPRQCLGSWLHRHPDDRK